MVKMRSVALVVVLAMALAACGGGSEQTVAGDTGATTGTTPGGADGDTGGGEPGVFDSAQCADAIAAWSEAMSAAGAVGTGSSSDLDTTIAQLKAFAEAAPDEIGADLMIVYEAYGAYLQAMEDSGYDPASGEMPTADQLAAIQTAGEALAEPDVTAASERVSDWFASNCGA